MRLVLLSCFFVVLCWSFAVTAVDVFESEARVGLTYE